MASLYKRGKVWYSKLTFKGHPQADNRGRLRIPLDTDRKIADGKLADLVKLRANKRYGVAARDISWLEWKKIYEPHSKSKSENTYKREMASIASLEAALPITRLHQLTPELLDRFKAIRVAARKKPGTVNRELGALVTMARRAELWKYLTKQDWRGVKRVRSMRKKNPPFFLLEQIRDQLVPVLPRETNPMWRTVIALGFDAGKRPAETYFTAWTDIDFDKNNGSGQVPGGVWVRPHEDAGFMPKDCEVRFIPFTIDLRELLLTLPRRGRWVLGPDRPANVNAMSVFFGRLVRKAGLTGNLNKLRHSFGSYLAMADTNLLKIRDLMGHSTVKTTEIYAALLPSTLAAAVNKLPRGLFGKG